RFGDDVFGGGHDPGALSLVFGVGDAGSHAGFLLDEDGVTPVHQLPDPDRGERHPQLRRLDLPGYPDDQALLLFHSSKAINVLASVSSPRLILSSASAIGRA